MKMRNKVRKILGLSVPPSKQVDKYSDLVNVIQQIFTFVHLIYEELATNEENVGQIPCLVDVNEGYFMPPPILCNS